MEKNLAYGEKQRQNNIVFTRPDGAPIRLAYLNEQLNGLGKQDNLRPITIHGLRHTHASLLFETGASIKEVQEDWVTQISNDNNRLYKRNRHFI
ncbi:tyrosine-type recombinase/integrase [Bacillus sp. OV322]|uniref:tyrosine-type recombinase/integrase n=1 Tax=Bacillus sp. OV322 TaxID=1882764 RepID=UPI000B89C94D|nr:tyrosine-type recombinase/integrase [Bacillus sp. OV322]